MMKIKLWAGLLLSALSASAQYVSWERNPDAVAYDVSVFLFTTNNAVVFTNRVVEPTVEFATAHGWLYKIQALSLGADDSIIKTNEVYYRISKVNVGCTNRDYCISECRATTLRTNGLPSWSFCIIPCEQHRNP